MKTGISLSICIDRIITIQQQTHREAVSKKLKNSKSYQISSVPLDSRVDLQERMEDVAEDVDANRFSLLSMMISSPFLMLYR